MSHLDEGTLHALLDGELDLAEISEIQKHLGSCVACGSRLQEVKQVLAEAFSLPPENVRVICPHTGGAFGCKGYTWPQRFQSLPGTLPIVLVIGIIFYSMLFGWATPTEAGALGALCVFVIALANKMKWPELRGALLETARLTAVIFTVVWGVLIFVRFLGFAGLP